MRAPTLALLSLLAGLAPAAAQISGSSNPSIRTNQHFETQNQIRNSQNRQSLENSAVRNQIQRAPLNAPPSTGPSYGPRR